MATSYRVSIAVLHFFLATFIWVQLSAPVSQMFGENKLIDYALFAIVSVSIFYLSYKKAYSGDYSLSKVLLITAVYFILSTLFVILSVPYLNVVLIVSLYYYLIKKEPVKILNMEI